MTNDYKPYYSAVRLGADKNPSRGTVIATGTKEEIDPLWIAGEVAICWNSNPAPIKRISQESLAKRRRTRTKNRLAKKFPLFADELFERELASKPAHFNGERPQLESDQ